MCQRISRRRYGRMEDRATSHRKKRKRWIGKSHNRRLGIYSLAKARAQGVPTAKADLSSLPSWRRQSRSQFTTIADEIGGRSYPCSTKSDAGQPWQANSRNRRSQIGQTRASLDHGQTSQRPQNHQTKANQTSLDSALRSLETVGITGERGQV